MTAVVSCSPSDRRAGAPAVDPAARAAEFCAVVEDPARLRRWVTEALPKVYGFVFVRCGADEALAEEIVQETMEEVVRHRRDYEGRAEPTTWVCGIARHKIADHYRAKYRRRRRLLRLVATATEASDEPGEASDTRDAVAQALRRLPESQRVVLALHYLDGLPVRDIGALIGRSESAVESLLARGRDGFRQAWTELQGERA